jgi:hypothetical protein
MPAPVVWSAVEQQLLGAQRRSVASSASIIASLTAQQLIQIEYLAAILE